MRWYLSMGYKKDIFAGFAYEFEPLHNHKCLVVFRLRRSEIFALQKLYCCYAAVILYSPPKLPKGQYNLAQAKYNCEAI